MFASDWLKGRHKIDALLDPFQHSRGHYPLITEGNQPPTCHLKSSYAHHYIHPLAIGKEIIKQYC